MYNNVFVQIFIIFINFFLSIPFTISGSTKYDNNDIKAYSQPPGYIFGIVWSTIYTLFSIINYRIMYSDRMTIPLKKMLINQSITEATLQTTWLLTTMKFTDKRYFLQYIIGLFIMFQLVNFAFQYRLKTLLEYDFISFLLYLPYCIWIVFAMILNIQIVYKYIVE